MRLLARRLSPLPLAAASAALSTLALAAGPPPARADGPSYFVDVNVREWDVRLHRCPGGVRWYDEVSTIWAASGSGALDGSRGILEVTRERWRFRGTIRGRGPERLRDVRRIWTKETPFRPTVTSSGGRIAVDVGRFSPVERVVRVPLPGAHQRREIDQVDPGRRVGAPRSADGCTVVRTRGTDVTGSVRRFS